MSMLENDNDKMTLRTRVGQWVESARVTNFIVILIIINAIIFGLATSASIKQQYGPILDWLDDVILGVFIVEIALKIYAFGWRFVKSGWNVFDFIIVAIALVPTTETLSSLRVLRILRVLRVLRIASIVPQLRLIVDALLHAIPGIVSTAGLLSIIYYIFAIIATNLYGEAFPEWFGTLGKSMYTLFQVMTLESWSMGIARPVMEVFPYAWLFFLPFILIATFTMLNLFVAIIVDTMQTIHAKEREKTRAAIEKATQTETETLEKEFHVLRADLNQLKALHLDNEAVVTEIRALRGEIGELKTLTTISSSGTSDKL